MNGPKIAVAVIIYTQPVKYRSHSVTSICKQVQTSLLVQSSELRGKKNHWSIRASTIDGQEHCSLENLFLIV
jgi:hypothetical protein